ncbi:hypothetical protein BM449_06080 [Synechococcus sp. SynAce01]|nr:hypothetical protein BM449_06080 [Synechococcus sp. SynAce01]
MPHSDQRVDRLKIALQVAELLPHCSLDFAQPWLFLLGDREEAETSFFAVVVGAMASKTFGLMAKIIDNLFSAIPRLVEQLQIGRVVMSAGVQEASMLIVPQFLPSGQSAGLIIESSESCAPPSPS